MSEKNGEIARELYEQIEDMTSAPIPVDCKKIIHEALDTQDRDHEALIGVLVGALSKIESDLDDAINGRDPVSDRAMWNEAKEALSHPLVQEYLKKEKNVQPKKQYCSKCRVLLGPADNPDSHNAENECMVCSNRTS